MNQTRKGKRDKLKNDIPRGLFFSWACSGNITTPPPFSEPTTQLLSRDLAMLRGLRMARIRPSRLKILNAGVKIRIGFTKNSIFQKVSKKLENLAKSQNSTPHYIDKLPIHRLGGPILAPGLKLCRQSKSKRSKGACLLSRAIRV